MSEQQRIAQLQDELKATMLRYLRTPGILDTAIPGLHITRREEKRYPGTMFRAASGRSGHTGYKAFPHGRPRVHLHENQCVVTGVHMPIVSWVDHPSHEHPFLFVYLYLDKSLLTSLIMEMNPAPSEDEESTPGVSVANARADIMEMFLRLLKLLDKTEQLAVRAPMMLRELHYLLLISPHGKLLRRLNTPGTQNHQVVQAINWIREHYKTPLRVESLARQVHMSASNLHRHFKLVTGMSPLQYPKQLRLHEARRLMFLENERASIAAISVGYESVTQFNREYKRVFGEPPLRDRNRKRMSSGSS